MTFTERMMVSHQASESSKNETVPIGRRKLLRQSALSVAGITLLKTPSLTLSRDEKTMSGKNHNNYVDAHVHVWTDDFQRYPLAAGFTRQDMKPAVFLPEEVRHHAEPCGVKRIVLVQMSYYRYDNSYMLDVIHQFPQVFRGIAVIDWKHGAPDAKMRELSKQGVRGFRIFPEQPSDLERLQGESFYKMLRCGAEEDLAMCFLINPDVLPLVGRICEKFPDTPVIVDHLARIGITGVIRESDIRALCALAKYPKTKVKVSAFYALGEKKPPHLDIAPLIRRVYDAFGPRRLMWASDCPFQVMHETYADSITLIRDRLAFLSSEDKEWILRRTAEESLFH